MRNRRRYHQRNRIEGHVVRYRIEFGFGDREQSIYAMFEAPDEVAARAVAIELLSRIKITGAWRVHTDAPLGDEVHSRSRPGRIDHTRWLEK
jgi:hypothetical protein